MTAATESDVKSRLADGRSRFMGVELFVAPGVLVPRAETELLGDTAVAELEAMLREASGDEPLRVIDMCTGAGNLACGVAHAVPRTRVWASDLTDACVALARRNVALLGLEARVSVLQGDLFAPLAGVVPERSIDLVVANPPYISTGRLAKDRAALLDDEPREAFDAGPYGLALHQRIVREAPAFVRPGGLLAMELGAGQERQVALLFKRTAASDVRFVSNAAGEPRVVVARF